MISFKQFISEAISNIDTPNFKNWFGNSKVVDADGSPTIVYHGTNDVIVKFEHDHINKKDSGWLGRGFYFTNNHNVANHYTTVKKGNTPNIMVLYLKIENPYYATLKEKEKLMLCDYRKDYDTLNRWREYLDKHNHDGVILDYGMSDGTKEYVVFNSTQIKSIFNNGNFGIDVENISEGR